METDTNRIQLTSATELRRIAEVRLGARNSELTVPQSLEETERIVHELEVHQIELTIQNEELRAARHEVESALDKYTDLYETAPIGYFTLNQSGSITALNLAGTNLLRIERPLLIGRNFEEFIAAEYRATFKDFLWRIFTRQGEESCELVLLDNLSQPVRVQIGATACPACQECRLALIDLSGQRPAGQQTDASNSATPSELTPAEMTLELSEFSLREILAAALVIFREESLKGGVELYLELACEVDERIVADRGKVEQIIQNLLSNAVKFTPAGGAVEVSAVRDGDYIKIIVADTGTGIKRDDIPNLFQTFEAPSVTDDSNASCCLAATKQLVELLGGSIGVESHRGTGSRFSFTIPLRDCTGII